LHKAISLPLSLSLSLSLLHGVFAIVTATLLPESPPRAVPRRKQYPQRYCVGSIIHAREMRLLPRPRPRPIPWLRDPIYVGAPAGWLTAGRDAGLRTWSPRKLSSDVVTHLRNPRGSRRAAGGGRGKRGKQIIE
jgi:hypothetical protein